MARSYQEVVSDGTLEVLSLSIEFMEATDIAVYFDDVQQALGSTWDWSDTNTITFTPAVADGVTVLVRRVTDVADPLHQFGVPGNAAFTKNALDDNFLQQLYVAQEAQEASLAAETLAEQSATSAAAAVLAAETAVTDAEAALVLAQGIVDSADGILDGAQAAADSAAASAAAAASSAEQAAVQTWYENTIPVTSDGQTMFTVPSGYTPGRVEVLVNGAQLALADFTAANGTSVTLQEGAYTTDTVVVKAWKAFTIPDAVLASDLAGDTGAALVGIGYGRTQADKNAEWLSVKDFGAVGDGVTDDSVALTAANEAATGGKVPLMIPIGIHIASPVTITATIVDGLHQMFSASSQVTINNGMPIRPDWWGDIEGSVRFAINALPATGGVIQLEDKVYKPNGFQYGFGGTGVSITKDNVKIVGRGMPQFSNDCKSLIGGSIIQGQFSVYANNFEARDFGIDSGKDVLDTYYGGVSQPGITEAFGISYPNDTVKAAAELRKNIRLHNIISLASGPSDQVHAFIIGEGVKGVECSGHIIGCMGYHGIVIKCADVRAEQFTSYCNAGEGVIIKSDSQATAVSDGIQIAKIRVCSTGPDGFSPYATSVTGFGVMFNPEANTVSNVQIGEIYVVGHLTGVGASFGSGNNTLRSVSIGSIITDQYGISGGRVGLSISGDVVYKQTRGFRVGRLESKNATYAFGNSSNPALAYAGVHIGSLHAVNCEWAAGLDGTSKSVIGDITTENVANGVFRFTGDAKIKVGSVTRSSDTATLYSNISGGLVPALAVDWSQHAGNDPFGVDLAGGRVHLRGLIQPTASSTIFASLPGWARPSTVKRFVAQGVAMSTNYAVPVVIGTDGLCSVNEVGGGVANCQQWLSLAGISWDID